MDTPAQTQNQALTVTLTLTKMRNSRNWSDLPRDVMLTILMKLSTFEIYNSAQFVCKFWYNLCKDPSLWRVIKMKWNKYDYCFSYFDLDVEEEELRDKRKFMLYDAIARSSGGLHSFDIQGFDHFDLFYLASRSNQLKHLRLAYCSLMSFDKLIKAFSKLSQLEELELTHCIYQEEAKSIIPCCPFLKTLKLNRKASRKSLACDNEAVAIADSMHELRHLQLLGNAMTNKGLKAILDSCPHLQSLDLRGCFHVDFDGDLGKRCAQQIKDFCHQYDATDGRTFLVISYESDTESDEIIGDAYVDMDTDWSGDEYRLSDEHESSDDDGFSYLYEVSEDDALSD